MQSSFKICQHVKKKVPIVCSLHLIQMYIIENAHSFRAQLTSIPQLLAAYIQYQCIEIVWLVARSFVGHSE